MIFLQHCAQIFFQLIVQHIANDWLQSAKSIVDGNTFSHGDMEDTRYILTNTNFLQKFIVANFLVVTTEMQITYRDVCLYWMDGMYI